MSRAVEADVVLSYNEHLPAVDVWLVIDVLRASTVIVRWFELGGQELYPTMSSSAARALAKELAADGGKNPLLMGEENAIPPQGFDMGNSPSDLTRETVQSRSCAVMSTTNGTRALLAAAETGVPVIAVCMRNASAALGHALSIGSRIGILCAGRIRRPAWDDTLCAGFLLDTLLQSCPELIMADSARLAHLTWRSSSDGRRGINPTTSMESADHAVFLRNIGYGQDIRFACEADVTNVVPVLTEEPNGESMRAVIRCVPGTTQPLPAAFQASLDQPAVRRSERADDTAGLKSAPFVELLTRTEDIREHFFLGGNRRRRNGMKFDVS